jgi:hypothetical protein
MSLALIASGQDLSIAHVENEVSFDSGSRNRSAGGKPLNGFF